MLQAIDGGHDVAFMRDQANATATLVAARNDGKKHLLLAATGSVATIKIPVIVNALKRHHANLSIRVVLTEAAQHFLGGQSAEQPTVASLSDLPGVDAVYTDACEWGPEPWRRGAPILHIELRRWADILVIAPLSANSLAKIVNGMSDNLLLSCIRAWDTDGSIDGVKKSIVAYPAMNTAMWNHPVTARQLRVLEDDWGLKRPVTNNGEIVAIDMSLQPGWFEVIRPISKGLACGDTGNGAMASVETIVNGIEARLGLTGVEFRRP